MIFKVQNLKKNQKKNPAFTEQSKVKYEIEKQWNISNTVNLNVISNLMHFEFIEIYLATFVQNIKFVNVLGNLCPGHLENAIICKDPFSENSLLSYYLCAYHICRVWTFIFGIPSMEGNHFIFFHLNI